MQHPVALRSAARRLVVPALVALLAAGCGGHDAAPPTEPPAAGAATIRVDGGTFLRLVVGDRRQLAARVLDARGEEMAGAPVTWSVEDTSVAAVDTGGTVAARASGSTRLSVASGRASLSIDVLVSPRVDVARVVLYPRTVVLAPGGAGVVVARRTDALGVPTTDVLPTFRSSAPEVVEVSGSGALVAHAPGTATITASVQGHESSSVVRVVPALASTFDVELRVVGDTAAVPMEELRRAVARWRRVIASGDAPQRVSLAAGACEPWIPAIDETVAHLLVFVRATPMDGPSGIIAGTGVCAMRAGSRQPAVASFEIDAADVASERSRGSLESTIAHELGHALGFATGWYSPEPALVDPRVDLQDYLYLGAGALAAAANWGAIAPGGPFWLENRGGPGSAGSHWHPQLVGSRELMTAFGFAGNGALSVVTVGAMRDLGYVVDETGADWTYGPFAVGAMAERRAAAMDAPRVERVTAPRWVLGGDGRPIAR